MFPAITVRVYSSLGCRWNFTTVCSTVEKFETELGRSTPLTLKISMHKEDANQVLLKRPEYGHA